jgi:hypothetical protein
MATAQSVPYRFTRHARERYLERCRKEYKHLMEHGNVTDCQSCSRIKTEIATLVQTQSWNLCREMEERLAQAKEERSYLNNTEFMGQLYKKYGYDFKPCIMVHEDAMFVVSVEPGKKLVLSVLNTQRHVYGGRFLNIPRVARNHVRRETRLP